jgi:hypothetical protein
MGKGLGKTLQCILKHFSPHAPTIIVINEFKEEEHVERRTTNQHVEVEQPISFSSKLIQGRFLRLNLIHLTYLVLYPPKHGLSV